MREIRQVTEVHAGPGDAGVRVRAAGLNAMDGEWHSRMSMATGVSRTTASSAGLRHRPTSPPVAGSGRRAYQYCVADHLSIHALCMKADCDEHGWRRRRGRGEVSQVNWHLMWR